MARDAVAKLLADKVEQGYFTEEEAVTLGQKILRENPSALYCGR